MANQGQEINKINITAEVTENNEGNDVNYEEKLEGAKNVLQSEDDKSLFKDTVWEKVKNARLEHGDLADASDDERRARSIIDWLTNV